jgi:putative phosphoribosyl transferase
MIRLPFRDREQAGQLLAAELARRPLPANVTVLALPRGGVPVGLEVAKALHAPLDVVVVRKLGVPWQPELAMGAIAGRSVQVLDRRLIEELRISQQELDAAVKNERAELERREHLYRGGRPALDLHARTALIVDDGLATGSTMLVAVRYVHTFKPAKTMIAVPVGSVEACHRLKREVDDFVCLATPELFMSVGQWFADFRQVTDLEVQHLLDEIPPESERKLQHQSQ